MGCKSQCSKEIPTSDTPKYPDDNVPNDPVPAAASYPRLMARAHFRPLLRQPGLRWRN